MTAQPPSGGFFVEHADPATVPEQNRSTTGG
jgi:hypothetical protein